jgi:hypothetical protein
VKTREEVIRAFLALLGERGYLVLGNPWPDRSCFKIGDDVNRVFEFRVPFNLRITGTTNFEDADEQYKRLAELLGIERSEFVQYPEPEKILYFRAREVAA